MKFWDDLSDWYDKRQGETGDLWHRALIDPPLLRLIGDCGGIEVLDLGCGNGYLARRLARGGARVTAIDYSLRMIENAQAYDPEDALKICYIHADASRLNMIADASFDLVFANMSLMDIEDAEGAIREVSRVLKRNGRFVASICHPCYDTMSNSGWVTEKVAYEPRRIYRKVRAYRKPFVEDVPWRFKDDERRYTSSFHRPLNWYSRVFSKNGLAITALEEPEPLEEFLEKEEDSPGFYEVPLHIVFETRKYLKASF